jgi:hypothetical protein
MQTFTHEFEEVVTDPNIGPGENAGFSIAGPAGCEDEAADRCCGQKSDVIGWYNIEKFWAPQESACIAPASWEDGYVYHNTARIPATGQTRHLASGWWGSAFQDGNSPYHVWVAPASGNWQDTGTFPGGTRIAQLAVSADSVVALTGDLSAVYRYDPVAGSWSQILGANAQQIYAGRAGIYAVNNSNNHFYRWTGQMNWSHVGSPGNQFVVADDGVYAITPTHGQIYFLADGASSWTLVSAGVQASELYAGPVRGFAMRELSAHDLYWYDTGGLVHIGTSGYTFAVTGDPQAEVFTINPNRTAVYQLSNHPWISGAGWINLDNGKSALIGGGSPYLFSLWTP